MNELPRNMPTPPWELVMPPLSENVALVAGIVFSIGAVLFVLSETKRRGDLVPIYILLGSLLGCFFEPMADWLVLVIWPEHHQYFYMEVFGRRMPLINFFAYFYYFPPFTLIFLRWVEDGVTATQWWKMAGLIWIFAFAFDCTFINTGLVNYYGPHPLRLFNVPIWAITSYAAIQFAIGAGVHGLIKVLAPNFRWLIIAAITVINAAVQAGLALPATIAMYSTTDPVILALCGISSVLLSIAFVWILGLTFIGTAKAGLNSHADDVAPARIAPA